MADAAAGWTDERVQLLGRLWSDGLSASQIAAALGGGVTRNAVIGKVHRLGLSGRVKGAPASAPTRTAKPKVLSPSPPVPERARPLPIREEAGGFARPGDERLPVRAEEIEIPVSQRVSILDLRDSMCRWPLGDPSTSDFGFCGGKAVTGLAYCGPHCRIAFQPAGERKRLRA